MEKQEDSGVVWKPISHLRQLMNVITPHPPLTPQASQTAPLFHSHPTFHPSQWPVFPISLNNAQTPSLPHTTLASLSHKYTGHPIPNSGSHSKIQVIQPGPQPPLQPWPHSGHTHQVSAWLHQSLLLGSQH